MLFKTSIKYYQTMGTAANIVGILLLIAFLETNASVINRILSVDWKFKENAVRHRTSDYEMLADPLLVIRRGDSFEVRLKFNNKFDVEKDQLRLNFTYDSKLGASYDSIFVAVVEESNAEKGDKSSWDAFIKNLDEHSVTLQISVPANVAIGYWYLQIASRTKGHKPISIKTQQLAILFNPWCKDDSVYMPNEEHRHEYVLNPIGQVYLGSHYYMQSKVWKFGQFSNYIYPITIALLERYFYNNNSLSLESMANPTLIARALSSVLNANDGDGIIAGKWSEPYKPFTEPSEWTGSVEIFKKFYENEFQMVRWGQCWVFASSTTTASRAIGLPARPVSCFGSRHDTDESLTIDTYFDESGEPIEDMNTDMQWNFHVWTEVWFSRNDVPDAFGGWQVIDATPQEESDGLSQAGPAPVDAAKKGEIGYGYDTAFVYGEVDADIVHWFRNESDDLGWTKVDVDDTPTLLLTKKIGYFNNSNYYLKFDEDVTDTYKYDQGSNDRIMAHRTAAENRGLKFIFDKKTIDDKINLDLKIQHTTIGETIKIRLNITNEYDRQISVSSLLNVKSVYYRGLVANAITKDKSEVIIAPKGFHVHEIEILPEDYLDKLVDFDMIKVFAVVLVDGDRIWSKEATSMLEKPKLNLSVKGHIRVGQTLDLQISFTNPLNKALTNGKIVIEFKGNRIVKNIKDDVKPHSSLTIDENIELTSPGYETIVVTFDSEELSNMYGYIVLLISSQN